MPARRWLETTRLALKESTVRRQQTCIKTLSPFFKGVTIRNATARQCERWTTERGREIAPQTFAHELNTLNVVFNYAVRQGLVVSNPAQEISAAKSRRRNSPSRRVNSSGNSSRQPAWPKAGTSALDSTRSRTVLHVDGEMAMAATKNRHAALSYRSSRLHYLHHKRLFHECSAVLNLSTPSSQLALLQHCLAEKIEVLFLDNLSCLFSGIKENDADSWETVLPWLLELRGNRIAAGFIHHAGCNGAMRGTSRRAIHFPLR